MCKGLIESFVIAGFSVQIQLLNFTNSVIFPTIKKRSSNKNTMENLVPKPNLISYFLLPLLYYYGVEFCMSFAMTPEGTVIFWLPNAFSLAALLYYRGQKYWLLMFLVLVAEIAGDLPLFSWSEAIRLGLTNIAEVTLAYHLMRKFNMSSNFNKLEDVIKFIVAGPLIASFFAAFSGAAIIHTSGNGTSAYLSLVQTWWFGDALGLIIGTPFILSVLYNIKYDSEPLKPIDIIVAAISISLILLIIIAKNGLFHGLVITPTLLIPSMLYLALRTNPRWTAIAVFIFSSTIAMLISIGRNPFGELPLKITILHAQEFITILSLACLGFSILMTRIRNHDLDLHAQVKRSDN
jgi:integral membrane sensor domain MASE1